MDLGTATITTMHHDYWYSYHPNIDEGWDKEIILYQILRTSHLPSRHRLQPLEDGDRTTDLHPPLLRIRVDINSAIPAQRPVLLPLSRIPMYITHPVSSIHTPQGTLPATLRHICRVQRFRASASWHIQHLRLGRGPRCCSAETSGRRPEGGALCMACQGRLRGTTATREGPWQRRHACKV
jgi:hypothetical protein